MRLFASAGATLAALGIVVDYIGVGGVDAAGCFASRYDADCGGRRQCHRRPLGRVHPAIDDRRTPRGGGGRLLASLWQFRRAIFWSRFPAISFGSLATLSRLFHCFPPFLHLAFIRFAVAFAFASPIDHRPSTIATSFSFYTLEPWRRSVSVGLRGRRHPMV